MFDKDSIFVIENTLGIKLHWYQKLMLKILRYYDYLFKNGSKIHFPLNNKKRLGRNL